MLHVLKYFFFQPKHYAGVTMADKITQQTTTQKHKNFVSEPMGNKNVNLIPGIGTAYASHLHENGFHKAYMVLGKYLVLDKDNNLFKDWLREIVKNPKSNSLNMTTNAINDFCMHYI